jgi:hypothetical protein
LPLPYIWQDPSRACPYFPNIGNPTHTEIRQTLEYAVGAFVEIVFMYFRHSPIAAIASSGSGAAPFVISPASFLKNRFRLFHDPLPILLVIFVCPLHALAVGRPALVPGFSISFLD